MKRIVSRGLLHLVLWVGVWFYFYYFFSYNTDDKGYVLWFASLLLPLTIGLSYFAIYFLIPRYLLTRQYGRFALFSFYTLAASSYFIVIIIYGCMFIYQGFNPSRIPPMVKNFFFILILVYLVVGLVSLISILNQNFKTEKRNQDLQNKILSAQLQFKEQELNYLKKQIHPHFLFNTLNTIYGLALKQSLQTPDVILKLSNLLDYILYQVDKPRVSLKDEIAHIQEYIELEKIRFKDSVLVEFDPGSFDQEVEVAPMILIPLVENAFKHGSRVDGYLRIKIQVRQEEYALDFIIQNTLVRPEDANSNAGIGLENLRKRLDLNYSGNFELENSLEHGWYHARLSIHDLRHLKHE